MKNETLQVKKSSGEIVHFSVNKLKHSLRKSGASEQTVQHIADQVQDELYQGISTREIYNKAYALLKNQKSMYASKYKLKKAIYELGPTGFPFERFVAQIYKHLGYKVIVGQQVAGKCVAHEVDVIVNKGDEKYFMECKFHGEEGRKCDVKIPLYIQSRYQDILKVQQKEKHYEGWVVTNTRFTADAIQYSRCIGLKLMSWDYPKDNSFKDKIDRVGLYPITVSTLLSRREKSFLLEQDIVLCKDLLQHIFLLDHLGMSDTRKERVLEEFEILCNV